MGFNNPSVSWSEMERLLSDRRRPTPPPGDGGDSPAWSHKRGPYVAPPIQRPAQAVPYAELHAHSSFSFLDGASSPEDLAEEAERLGLHALEFGAGYRDEGHVWSERTGDVERAAQGDGGFLTRLGNSLVPGALVAEVYSFPTGGAKREGSVALSVEAEVTAGNCGTTVEAQMLDRRGSGRLGVNDLSLDMPACDSAVGDFLVLNNLVEDLKIAAR